VSDLCRGLPIGGYCFAEKRDGFFLSYRSQFSANLSYRKWFSPGGGLARVCLHKQRRRRDKTRPQAKPAVRIQGDKCNLCRPFGALVVRTVG
jgi:hypothetical protein